MKITINTDLLKKHDCLGLSYAVALDGGEEQFLTVPEIFHVISEVLLTELPPGYMHYTKKDDLDPEETQG